MSSGAVGAGLVPLVESESATLEAERLRWGIPANQLYRLGLSFYRDKEGKALHLSYEDKLKLIAYTQQSAHGSFNDKTAPPLGVLDVIGRDRRAAWLELGNMSQTQAMIAFIHMIDRLCPLFKPFVEANRKDSDEQKKISLKQEVSKELLEVQKHAEQEQRRLQQQKSVEEEQIRRIKDALNEQTYDQFLQYACQQFPGNPDQQAILVRQLQDQHYHQYIQQLALNRQTAAKERLSGSENYSDMCAEKPVSNDKSVSVTDITSHISESLQKQGSDTNDDSSPEQPEDSQSDDGDGFPTVASASMWTRGGTSQFKQTVRNAAGGGGVLQVGHGETVTIRVPTHVQGRCLFWEFATDNFDIGFGVYFEWTKSPTTQVTVHVAESDDEGDIEEIIERCTDDLESGSGTGNQSLAALKPPLSIIIPIYRRDSHLEVYAGSHAYPGEGVYLLKFDNTFSLWRSKTLYYRVYYTR
ncbi:Golgi resident protein GCP60 isoform X2 [Arctopsyche grandis]|uniref:Golgi resident protein GCP60 isoform X2 n=1 Tax=Arctopsyche grandis TaxID=121162 RepID=UPI00406D9571